MIQQDDCPFTYMVPPVEEYPEPVYHGNEVYFFTDASMKRNQIGGTYALFHLDKQWKPKDRVVGYSLISNIDYLECKAIYYCLCYIYWRAYPGIKYYIFTDSSTCYESIKKLCNNQQLKSKRHWFHKQVTESVQLYLYMSQSGIDVEIVDVKGHCFNFDMQKKYLENKGFNFDSKHINLIMNGNNQVDKFVGMVRENKNQYPYLLYDN